MCGCCVRIMAQVSVRVRIKVRDGVRINNRVRGRVKLVNYSLITALPIAASADPLFNRGHARILQLVLSCSAYDETYLTVTLD